MVMISTSRLGRKYLRDRILKKPLETPTDVLQGDPPNTSQRWIHQHISQGAWEGERCFIVGGGPSLTNFDWSRLDGELTIGVNRAFEMFDPTIIFSMDACFWNYIEAGDYGPAVRERFQNYDKGFKVWLSDKPQVFTPDIFIVNRLGNFHWGESLANGIGGGGNSGYGALNLACLLGADPIYLLGYDMRGGADGNQAWWHSGHRKTQYPPKVYPKFVEAYKRALPSIRAMGKRIINLSPNSALRCFEMGDLSTITRRRPYPLVVAYYTRNTGYEEEVRRLRHSLLRFSLKSDIRVIDSLGSWQKNTQYKARFLLQMLKEHPGEPLLYVDADAEFVRAPALFRTITAACGVHWRDKGNKVKELLSGTIYLNGGPESHRLVEDWITENDQNPDVWDQRTLQGVLIREKALDGAHIPYRHEDIPAEYCAIFDTMHVEKPVILHHQASRRLKLEVNAVPWNKSQLSSPPEDG